MWRDTLLPFTPTGDQAAAMDEIDADLAAERPMQRLLMGEVGSGKTVVALHAMLRAVEHGMQAALMAPTETLAEQHFATLQALMPGSLVPVALLTGSTPAARRADLLGKLRTGELQLIVGTHALIEEAVEFERLAVAVVDEQHRFGVRQRAALDAKAPDGLAPHVLHMTATPIPRTLRLAAFGALDVTDAARAAQGPPADRRRTSSRGERERERAYERIREELRAGRQAFVVCPLVERVRGAAGARGDGRVRAPAGDRVRATSASCCCTARCARARRRRRWRRSPPASADVLVATTVIEVGIDVPNATVMLVEDAERYGISQLHQLRGRVGRGERPVAVPALRARASSPRLQALAQHGDGFELAEIDLELRGEGELTGTRQSGLARFRFARLPEDAAILERAHARATALLREDPGLRAPELRAAGRASSRRPTKRARGRREGRRRAPRRPAARGAARAATRGRPSDRVREALFSMLGPLDGARVLDLFAGLGRAGHRGALARGGERACSSSATAARVDGHPRQSRGARARRGRGARGPRAGARGRSATHRRAATHTIWSSSTRRTGTRRRWDGSSRRPCPPCWRPRRASSPRATAARRSQLDLPVDRERRYGDTLIRIHEHGHLIPASPSAPAPTTRSPTATSTSSRARRELFDEVVVGVVNHPGAQGQDAVRRPRSAWLHQRGDRRTLGNVRAEAFDVLVVEFARARRGPRDRQGPARDLATSSTRWR